MKRCLTAILLLAITIATHPQTVGLVLSGGGAKGIAHIGIIKALEENEIPIDYITGTSMGAIVGALYAMGYTPDEMEEMIKSDEFKRWYSGQIEDKYIYYFKHDKPAPDFFKLRISLRDSAAASSKQYFLPTSLVNPIQMNIAFMYVFSQATAQCKGDFDDLLVPFRCVGSDVYNKQEVVYAKGDLGDAVRASMSFPFVFRPMKKDSTLIYDGGIYNNFPADVMANEFKPGIMIGSAVAENPKMPDEKDLISQIESMIMHKTDYSLPDTTGIMMNFYFSDVSLLDFDKIDKISKAGYDKAMEIMDTIKSKINRRITKDEMELRRKLYKENIPELVFKDIEVTGATPQQTSYIKKEIYSTAKNKTTFTYEDFKKSYFKLLADGIISEIIPHAVYNHDEGLFDLKLEVKTSSPLAVSLGGHISNASNQIYVGVSYKDLHYYSKDYTFEGQVGKVYSNAQLAAKLDLATALPTSYKVVLAFNSFNYTRNNNAFFNTNTQTLNRKEEVFAKFKVAFPFMLNKKAEISFGVASQRDTYYQSDEPAADEGTEKSIYKLIGGAVSFGGNTLNTKQHPTQGSRDELVAQIYAGNEKYREANSSESQHVDNIAWIQISYKNETYYNLHKNWAIGTYIEGYYSSRNFSKNYRATMLAAGQFAPVPQLRLTYNEDFRANQYIAAGIKPIYKINSLFHISAEAYVFLPMFPIESNNLGNAQYAKVFSKYNCFAQLNAVCVLPFASASVYANYSRYPSNQWNFGITLGWQIFNETFFD